MTDTRFDDALPFSRPFLSLPPVSSAEGAARPGRGQAPPLQGKCATRHAPSVGEGLAPSRAFWTGLILLAVALLWAGPTFAEEEAIFPERMPSFKALDENQVPVPSSRFEGKVVLLDFWASWCRPCRFTLPELERLHREYGERDDFVIVGLAIDEGRSGGVRARRFAEKARVTYTILHDFSSQPAKPQFNIEVVPALFLVAADGKILRRWDGEPEFPEVEAAVREALGVADEPAEAEDAPPADG